MTPMVCPITGQVIQVNPESVESFLKLGYVIKDEADKKGKTRKTERK